MIVIQSPDSPVRYPHHHKAEAHARIVQTASREFRAKGVAGVGIADLMAKAGLTHGGFYAHFKDRDTLVSEAVTQAAEESLALLRGAAEGAPPGREVEAMIDAYLSREHRDDAACGCLLPSLAADVSRQSADVRHAFTQSLRKNLETLAAAMPGRDRQARQSAAAALIAAMAGAVLLARAVDDPKLSKSLLNTLRDDLVARFAPQSNR